MLELETSVRQGKKVAFETAFQVSNCLPRSITDWFVFANGHGWEKDPLREA